MFALGQAESDFSIGIESYVWEIFQPPLEETPYRIASPLRRSATDQSSDSSMPIDELGDWAARETSLDFLAGMGTAIRLWRRKRF